MILTVPVDALLARELGKEGALELAQREAERKITGARLIDVVVIDGSPVLTYRFRV